MYPHKLASFHLLTLPSAVLASLSGDPPEAGQRGPPGSGLCPPQEPSKSSQGSLLIDPCLAGPPHLHGQGTHGWGRSRSPGGEMSPTKVSWPGCALLSLSPILSWPFPAIEEGRKKEEGDWAGKFQDSQRARRTRLCIFLC